ncbi:exosortase system-associated protein, TIGR04073 family [Geomonas sp. Red69]|uniref:Exosortase system-associated protein, TIGR04073 family n=1 Tax=Geomonas diazotrophica TaxID=2843197 RepID=A0ABX8JK78_9BACT|nr:MULTISPECIES: exosortase system-associated protein, TIGR04073 family [Geomonas]MBU5635421.1 exosortase system-associated protein, TIGR04073 family [Geomonas diazotrophica]QWV97526.1 exosortase system-associated protein, TIGR04073 family [Geomonas nitrogeniifigens]QXE86666.1 exosortase system-associated protein, TIGR04073 family [Geomonas nitrogeniifigens]
MRTKATLLSLLLLMVFATSSFALEGQQPEAIAEKMAFKLVRGVTNTATSLVEVPKQSYLMVRDRGGIGYVVGPLKGVGMAFYRLLTGLTETVFFAVPQPGYYDSMITPEFVWEGWEEKRVEPRGQSEAQPVPAKGE